MKIQILPVFFAVALSSLASAENPSRVEGKKAPLVSKMSPLAAGMKWIGKAVDEPDYYVWCTSPILGDDGRVHLFCSRWPKNYHFGGWSTHSEIAHYIGEKPEGPFRFSEVAIAAKPGAPWNNSIHCPAIGRAGNRFVLLYQTFDHRPDSPYRKGETPGCGKMYTCMAVADTLQGPWKKIGQDGMIIAPSLDPKHWTYQTWSMDNPTFLEFGGKYYIYFKAAKTQLKSRYGYAVADALEGPYKLSDAPCTDNLNYIEDATVFVWDKKICLVTNDNFGSHTGMPGRGILWKSDTPTNFCLSDAEVAFLLTRDYCKNVDTTKARALYGKAFKFERPGFLMIDGRPAYFYAPSGTNLDGDDHTVSYVMKIELEKN
jgi:hypothetical protein